MQLQIVLMHFCMLFQNIAIKVSFREKLKIIANETVAVILICRGL